MRTDPVQIDLSDSVRDLERIGASVDKEMPKLIARLVLKGEGYMKRSDVTPYRTGTLRRGIHGYPTIRSTGIAANVNYAFYANVSSRKPGFIESTTNHVISIVGVETDLMLERIMMRIDDVYD